ncbi:MAG: hypothetical protein WDM96_18095 [Lacunisphaera sp.]
MRESGPALREHSRRTPANDLVEKHNRTGILGCADHHRAFVDPHAVPLDVGLEKQRRTIVRHGVHHEPHRLQKPLPPHWQRFADLGHIRSEVTAHTPSIRPRACIQAIASAQMISRRGEGRREGGLEVIAHNVSLTPPPVQEPDLNRSNAKT